MIGFDLLTDFLPGFAVVTTVPLVLWWYMRKNRGATPSRLRITDKAAMGKSTWVAVVEVDEKRFLVGAGESGVGLISELEALPEMEEATDASPVSNGITEQPRTGLVRRLQLMTVRGPAQSPWRLFGDRRR